MDIEAALEWASQRRHGVLITIRRDGRPQSSDVSYFVADGTIVISVTDDRAKTRNLRRDPRAVFHVTEPGSWSYVSFDGMVELSPVATEPDDGTADGLVEYYRSVTGEEHPDWDEYRRAMVDEGRLLVRLTPISVVGQVHT
ncbi:MAG: PPOX class F420-dependent oxidoreductase [Acidimicrobiia bacterium]|nr:PPOX class F420-dependent oxidoreductase [Acidimicrobiia bacterium]